MLGWAIKNFPTPTLYRLTSGHGTTVPMERLIRQNHFRHGYQAFLQSVPQIHDTPDVYDHNVERQMKNCALTGEERRAENT